MSLRQALTRTALPLARPRPSFARGIASSAPRRADHSHDQHHGANAGPDDTITHESWFSAPWRNTFIIVALGYLVYPYLPERDTSPASAYTSPDNFERLRSDPNVPYLTRLIARNMDTAATNIEKRDKHMEDVFDVADTRLLLQDAQMPRVRKTRNTLPFDKASPFGVPVGSESDYAKREV